MKRVILTLLICLLLVIGLLFYLRINFTPRPGVIFFNIGQGDAALIKLEGGLKILVDCGPDRKVLSKLGKYLPFYDRQIDYLVVSHFDLDHYGGCIDVLKRYSVKNIVENGDKKIYDPYWQEWEKAMKAEKAETFVVTGPTAWSFGSSTLEFIFPDSSLSVDAAPGDGNNHSVVFRLTTPSTTVLFIGDAEEPLEKALAGKYCGASDLKTSASGATQVDSHRYGCESLHSNILKAGHHGSDSSSSQEFLEAVRPDKVIISVGPNKFGHPSLRVMRRMERLWIEMLRTDELGDIVL